MQDKDGKFAPIDPESVYSIVSNDFNRKGGDEYTVFAEKATDVYDFGRPLDQVLIDYIAGNNPVSPKVEGRITRADKK